MNFIFVPQNNMLTTNLARKGILEYDYLCQGPLDMVKDKTSLCVLPSQYLELTSPVSFLLSNMLMGKQSEMQD